MTILNRIKNFLHLNSKDEKLSILADETTPDFSKSYPPALAEKSKFVMANTNDPVFDGYVDNGVGKSVMLTYEVNSLDAVDFSRDYNPSLAERSKFVELNLDVSLGWPETNYPKYAVLTYNLNPPVAGSSFDQELNTTDSPSFSALTTPMISSQGDLNLNGNGVNINGEIIHDGVNFVWLSGRLESGVDTQAVTSRVITFGDTWGVAPVVQLTFAEEIGQLAIIEIVSTTTEAVTYQIRTSAGLSSASIAVNWTATKGN